MDKDDTLNIKQYEINILEILQKSQDKNIAQEASIELANRITWTSKIPDILVNKYKYNYFNGDINYYICSFGGCGSKILQKYLSNFGNTHHIHSRVPPKMLTRVGTEEYPEWFNNIKISEKVDRQYNLDQIKNVKVIYLYRNPIDAIHSRFIPGKTHRISTDHLNNITADHWNIESVIGNMMDLWQLNDFYNNYTKPDDERNYKIYCVNYEKFWDNIELFNSTMELPNIKSLYPVRHESNHEYIHVDKLNEIYKLLIENMNAMPPIKIV